MWVHQLLTVFFIIYPLDKPNLGIIYPENSFLFTDGPSFSCVGRYEVKENDKFQISCEPMGSPIPTVTWFKDGKEVHQQHWTKYDGGKYVVKANNNHGTASHEVEVDVMCKFQSLDLKNVVLHIKNVNEQ